MQKLLSAVLAVSSFAAFAADPLPRAKPETVGMSSTRLARIGAALKADVDKGRLPGAVVAVARKGKLVYFEAGGLPHNDARAPTAPHPLFSLAPHTKPATPAPLLQLYQ